VRTTGAHTAGAEKSGDDRAYVVGSRVGHARKRWRIRSGAVSTGVEPTCNVAAELDESVGKDPSQCVFSDSYARGWPSAGTAGPSPRPGVFSGGFPGWSDAVAKVIFSARQFSPAFSGTYLTGTAAVVTHPYDRSVQGLQPVGTRPAHSKPLALRPAQRRLHRTTSLPSHVHRVGQHLAAHHGHHVCQQNREATATLDKKPGVGGEGNVVVGIATEAQVHHKAVG